ncbi:unnamed protein product [Polarella glacialis]|uniref:N-acetyltransferase domain-containing protein n=1 Tax=Polarella glacialis TaxID=89957 RepID=A0A813KRB1_POLGL|nr:unnamed protein product [Polarella glacialis]
MEGGATCSQCSVRQLKDNFSKKQWSLKEGLRKCKTCVDAPTAFQSVESHTLQQEVADEVKSVVPQGASTQTACELVLGGGTCAHCGVRQPKDNFSKNQWSLKECLRKCKTCVGAPEVQKAAQAPTKVDPAELVYDQLAPSDYFQSEGRTQSWWVQYQEGFRAEQEWMEARGQKSLFLGMELDAESMAKLLFHTETKGFKNKVCFFARKGTDGDACAFATVDVDANQEQPCQLRMLLVAPDCQRQGVGLALLKVVVAHFGKLKRHLGLKFARCQDQENFFLKAGLTRIGMDDECVYMARRVIIKGARR